MPLLLDVSGESSFTEKIAYKSQILEKNEVKVRCTVEVRIVKFERIQNFTIRLIGIDERSRSEFPIRVVAVR